MKRRVLTLIFAAAFAFLVVPAIAMAGPRSGASFGGRGGFRSQSGAYNRSYNRAPRPAQPGGPSFIILPGFGWGWGGMGYGGFGLMSTLFMLGIAGLGAVMIVRAMRRARSVPHEVEWDEERGAPLLDRSYVYKFQLGLGRSARGIQERLARFAAEGDTGTETGLAQLLQQTSLELLREKHSIRYGAVEAHGPMTLANGETKLNGAALAERSRFQIERVRGADGKVRKAEAEAAESTEALEYVMVTVLVATRDPLPGVAELDDREQIDGVLAALGGVSPQSLLGLEVVWTPADPQDSLTQTDLITTYPHLKTL